MQGKHIDQQASEQVLKYAVDEHHYFEQFIEDIVATSFDDQRRKVLIQDLITQLARHMQYEEDVIFPQFSQLLTEEQQQAFSDEYLKNLKEIKVQMPSGHITF